MNRISPRIIAALAAVSVFALACNQQAKSTKTPPPPPAGFKNAKTIPRLDENGGSIIVDVAVGDNAIIVNSSTPPSADVALAWIQNTGTKKEKVYKFDTWDKATYVLYAKKAGGWRIEETKAGGQTDPEWKFGSFKVCDTHNAGVADVGFKTCQDLTVAAQMNHASMGGNVVSALFRRVLAFLRPADEEAPGWTACTDGCCTWSAQT